MPDRVSSATLFQMGETAVATVEALDAADLPAVRRDVRFSDLLSRGVLILTDTQALVGLVLACVAALVAWIRMLRSVVAAGAVHAAFTGLWGIVSNAAAAGAMLGAVWLLRDWREVYHPWYAQPWRLLALLVACGIAAPWAVTRLAWLLPQPLRYVRGPASVWAVVLPIWAAAAIASEVYAPAAAHLWMVPLGVAGLLLAAVPVDRGTWLRVASVVVLALVLTLFLRDGLLLFHVLIGVFGRLPIVTPLAAYPVLLSVIGVMIAPPAIATFIGLVQGRLRHGVAGSLLLAALAVTTALAFSGDAYTTDRPLRRAALYVDDRIANRVFWEVGSQEPGLDLELPAQEAAAWRPVDRATPRGTSVAVGPAGGAFLFRRNGEASAPPASIAWRHGPAADAPDLVEIELVVSPATEGLAAGLELPPGIVPTRATPAGREVNGRWRAMYRGVAAGGTAFRLRVPASTTPELGNAAVVIVSTRLPGAEGALLRWLPRVHMDWTTRAVWILPLSAATPAVDPPAALR